MSKNKEELMSLPGAAFTGIGASIGVALVAYIGFVIAAAGKASVISIIMGLTIGLLSGLPMYFLTKRTVIKGASAGLIEMGLGKASGAFCGYISIVSLGFMSTYPVSVSTYIVSAFPALAPFQQLLGFVILIMAVLVLCFGVKLFENVSKLFGVLLLIGLTVFTVLGLIRIVQNGVNPLDFSGDRIFEANGMNGILSGVPLFAATCTGFINIGYMGNLVKDPTKNVPKAVAISGFVMSFFWIFLTIVAANVLPVEQVAGQPLTFVAKEMMPEWMAIAFVITGPAMAILTTYIPAMQMTSSAIGMTASRGLLPKFLIPKNPAGGIDTKMIIIIGVVIGIINLLQLPVNVIIANLAPCTSFGGLLLPGIAHVAISYRRTDLMENKKQRSTYRIVSFAAAAAGLVLFILSVRAITLTSALISIALIITAYTLCIIKSKKGVQKAEATQ